jgi:hypothetical protein
VWVTPREVTTVVERVLSRCGFEPGVALTAAEYLAAGELSAGGYVARLASVLPALQGVPPVAAVELRGGEVTEIDGHDAFSLIAAASVLDVLESARAGGRCTVRHVRFPEFLGTLVPIARERGLDVELAFGKGSCDCRVCGERRPERSVVAFGAGVNVPDEEWASLTRHANGVLAPASEESRRDAGY